MYEMSENGFVITVSFQVQYKVVLT